MKLYGAIDLHSTNNVTVVINEQDQVVYQKRLPNTPNPVSSQIPRVVLLPTPLAIQSDER